MLLLVSLSLVTLTFIVIQQASARRAENGESPIILTQETQGDNTRIIFAEENGEALQELSPNIGFIDSPSATCFQPDSSQDVCYINWYYLYVDAAPNYMIALTVTLNSIGNVGATLGFFQTSMYIPGSMYDRGFKVRCGAKGAGGQPNLGNAYAYTIRARDSSNLTSANYGTVYCPAFQP